MKDTRGYIERMKASMKEKLFFVDKIDLNNKIIVDFGCAEGDLLQELDHMGLENTTLIGVENNAEFCSHIDVHNVNYHLFYNLTEVEQKIREWRSLRWDDREVVLICSSVLHELTYGYFKRVTNFACGMADYVVIRDMYWDNSFSTDVENNYSKIFRHCDNHLAVLFADLIEKREQLSAKVMAEFLLKYRYEANWDTEVLENYFSVPWNRIELLWAFQPIYDRKYINGFIKSNLHETFDIDLTWPTHRTMILKRTEE